MIKVKEIMEGKRDRERGAGRAGREKERDKDNIYICTSRIGCMYIHICTYGCHVYVYSVINIGTCH